MAVTEARKELQHQKQAEQDDIQSDNLKGPDRQDDEDSVHSRRALDIDQDAQEMVISSLRTQIQDLFSQVNQLNSKLVRSYDRVSDLEDSLHITTSNLQTSNQKITHLELEKSQHMSQLTSGLLVEKSHVTAELTRLMERATEEAAHRGQAESAKDKIEMELEELSANLFGEANGMVEEARIARSVSERKVEEAEGRLREAEEVVRVMQNQMQTIMQEKEDVEQRAEVMTIDSSKHSVGGVGDKLMKGHLAHQEFLAFLGHLRNLHATNPNGLPPGMPTLLQLPFLSRLLNEDAEPTLRLDLAPALNWLSRRSVLLAVHMGQLSIEPMSAATLLTISAESPLITISGMTPISAKLGDSDIYIPCALCGTSVFPIDANNDMSTSHDDSRESLLISSSNYNPRHNGLPSHSTWSAAAGFFRRPSIQLTRALSSTPTINGATTNDTTNIPPLSSSPAPQTSVSNTNPVALSNRTSSGGHINPQTQIYVFRLASLPSTGSTAFSSFISKPSSQSTSPPHSSAQGSTPSSHTSSTISLIPSSTMVSQPTTYYPLCTSGWCLSRLRTTCTLWSYIRTGIVEKIWDEEVASFAMSAPDSLSQTMGALVPVAELSDHQVNQLQKSKAPPLPPRRRGLWGIASALGERAASWGDGVSKETRDSKGSPFNDASSEGKNSPAMFASPPPLPKRSANRSLPPRAENYSPSPTSLTDIPTQSSSADITEPTESVAHMRNSSLSKAVNTPLPESRAGTPSLIPKINETNPHIDNSTPTPSQTVSPASPTIGPSPPPVPRRAATRKKVPHVDEPVKTVPQKVDADSVAKTNGVEVMTAQEGTVVEAKGEEAQVEIASSTSQELATDNKSVPTDREELAGAQISDSEMKANDLHLSSNNVEESDRSLSTDVENSTEAGENNDKVIEEARTEKHNLASDIPDDGDEHAELHAAELHGSIALNDVDDNIAPADETQFVGTSTWEEKAWRELVRLRKDMFYARVGSDNS